MRYTAQKNFSYSSRGMIVLLVQRMNAHSDDPRKGGTQSAQSSVAFGNIKKYNVLTKVSTRKHFSEYAYSRK